MWFRIFGKRVTKVPQSDKFAVVDQLINDFRAVSVLVGSSSVNYVGFGSLRRAEIGNHMFILS